AASREDLASGDAVDRINAWASENTRGLVPMILEGPPGNPGLLALNALYFKDNWARKFDAKDTRPEQFHGMDGAATVVPMMHMTNQMRVRRDDRFVAVDLPYATDRFSVVVLTTADRPAGITAFAGVAG